MSRVCKIKIALCAFIYINANGSCSYHQCVLVSLPYLVSNITTKNMMCRCLQFLTFQFLNNLKSFSIITQTYIYIYIHTAYVKCSSGYTCKFN